MTVRIMEDVEEAIAREIRRITFHDSRTVDKTILKEVFDPLTGEVVEIPIEPSFYDSSADASHIQYPHFFIQLKKVREDRFSGREVVYYGKDIACPVATSPKAYEIVLYLGDGSISSDGADIGTSTYRIAKVESGFLIRILSGSNKGTYKVDTVTKDAAGNHTITVSDELVTNLPELAFNSGSRTVTFLEAEDLSTIKVGDIFVDASSTSFNITSVDAPNMQIVIDGAVTPDSSEGAKITRSGDILEVDPSPVTFIVMDPSKPVVVTSSNSSSTVNDYVDPAIPLDLFYQIRIDSREKDDHTAIATRIWEEFFNPPRTALPIIVRSKLSADQLLTSDVATGGSNTLEIQDNSNYTVGETVFVFNNFTPTKSTEGRFDEPFTAKVVDKISNNQLVLDSTVPDTFKVVDETRVVSNAEFKLYMFHFVDHLTRDVEGAQYWVHEFQAIIQVWIDRQGDPETSQGPIQDIQTPIEDLDGNTILC